MVLVKLSAVASVSGTTLSPENQHSIAMIPVTPRKACSFGCLTLSNSSPYRMNSGDKAKNPKTFLKNAISNGCISELRYRTTECMAVNKPPAKIIKTPPRPGAGMVAHSLFPAPHTTTILFHIFCNATMRKASNSRTKSLKYPGRLRKLYVELSMGLCWNFNLIGSGRLY